MFLLATFFFNSQGFAQGELLIVGVQSFVPPFVMQGTNHELYGFDIDLVNSLCKIIQRKCQFKIMKFSELLPSVQNKTLDLAVSSITITADRAKIVSFTLPYLLSYSRFIQLTKSENQAFGLDALNNKKIGIETGTIFGDQIMLMGIKNPIIKNYNTLDNLLDGLSNGEVDYALIDNPTALYWASNSAGAIKTAGDAYMYGNGYGIAISKSNPVLLDALNKALLQYENSDDYKSNYNRYLSQF